MKRILFVDDEPKVLEGLQRMLRSMRRDWEMDFVESGREALDLLEKEQFDVIVSDMRMPGMDGVQLLTAIRELYPHMVRIALSGHSQREMVLRSVGPTHQYLAKPCDADLLKNVIARAFALRDVLVDERLREAVSQMQSVPSAPKLHSQIMEAIQEPDTSSRVVGEIIRQDIGMTAKLLHLANSAFFGLQRRVIDPVEAVNMLGVNTIAALVLSVHVFSQYEGVVVPGFHIDDLQRHSMMTGNLAKRISEVEGCDAQACDDAYMAGVLHDTGKLVLAANLSDRFQEALAMADGENITQYEAEKQVFGTSHAEVGAYLLGLWGLPDPIVEALMFHHSPMSCPGKRFSPMVAVYVANALEREGGAESVRERHAQVDMEFLKNLGLEDRLPLWQSLQVDTPEGEPVS